MGSIVVLSGPVGAGKTTVANELLASAPDASACIEGDAFWSFIAKAPAGEPKHVQVKMIVRAMLASARHFERDGYEVIVDFTIPPSFLDATRALLRGLPFDYVVLLPPESVCAARAAARPVGTIADYTEYRDLYRAFEDAGPFVLAGGGGEPAELAARIRDGLRAGRFRVT